MSFLAATVFKIIEEECVKNVTLLRLDKPLYSALILKKSSIKFYKIAEICGKTFRKGLLGHTWYDMRKY